MEFDEETKILKFYHLDIVIFEILKNILKLEIGKILNLKEKL